MGIKTEEQKCQSYKADGSKCTYPAKWSIHALPKEWKKGAVCGYHVEYWARIGGAHPITQTYEEWRRDWDALHGTMTNQESYQQWYEATHTGGRVKESVKNKLLADANRSIGDG